MMGWDWNTFWFVLLIGLLVVALVLTFIWFLSLYRKRKGAPSHVELYFDENFRKIIDEWDFSTRDSVKEFKKDIGKRLTKVGSDIEVLETKKKSLDKRWTALDKKMMKMEEL
ncbi:MAG: hypothetical protein ACMUIE_02485 [Thermoplasmatota archaeon]